MDSVLEYLTLRITAHEFLNRIMEDDILYERICSKIPQSRFAYDDVWNDSPICSEAFQYDDFDLRKSLSSGYYSLTRVQSCGEAYRLMYLLFRDEYPDLRPEKYYDDISEIAIEVVPDYVDSIEAGDILFDIILNASSMNDKARKSSIRTAIKERFHLVNTKKRPRWAQGSEWPVLGSEPMGFISQKKTGDKVEYIFEDIKTQERRVITQYY